MKEKTDTKEYQVYLDLSILEINKIVLCEFWYGDMRSKYGEKARLCYSDKDIS